MAIEESETSARLRGVPIGYLPTGEELPEHAFIGFAFATLAGVVRCIILLIKFLGVPVGVPEFWTDGEVDLAPPRECVTDMLLCVAVGAPEEPDCDPLPVPDKDNDPLVNSAGESVMALAKGINSNVCR